MNAQKFIVMENNLAKIKMKRDGFEDAYAHFAVVMLADSKKERDRVMFGMRGLKMPEEWESIVSGKYKLFGEDLKSVKSFVGKVVVHGMGFFDRLVKLYLCLRAKEKLRGGDAVEGLKMFAYLYLIGVVEEDVRNYVLGVDESLKYALLGGRADIDDEKFMNPISWIGLLRE